MKQCPKCGKTYDDSWGVCIECQVLLQKFDDTEGKYIITSLGCRGKRNPEEFVGNVKRFKNQIKGRYFRGKLSIIILVFTASVIAIAGFLAYQKEGEIPDFIYISLAGVIFIGYFAFYMLFHNSAEKSPGFSSSSHKKELIKKAIWGWYTRGVIISKPIEYYQESFSKVDALLWKNPFCFYDVRIGLEALRAGDFIEEGLSLEETTNKWGSFFKSIIENNGKDFLKD